MALELNEGQLLEENRKGKVESLLAFEKNAMIS